MRKSNKKGFTLVELLVVIAIIAIIAAVAVPVTISQIDKAKKNTAENEANNAISAFQTAITTLKSDPTVSTIDKAAVLGELNKTFIGIKQVSKVNIAYSSPKTTITVYSKYTGTEQVVATADIAIEIPAGDYTWGGSAWA